MLRLVYNANGSNLSNLQRIIHQMRQSSDISYEWVLFWGWPIWWTATSSIVWFFFNIPIWNNVSSITTIVKWRQFIRMMLSRKYSVIRRMFQNNNHKSLSNWNIYRIADQIFGQWRYTREMQFNFWSVSIIQCGIEAKAEQQDRK